MDTITSENIRDAKEALKHDIGAQITLTEGIYGILNAYVIQEKERAKQQKERDKLQKLQDKRLTAANNAFMNASLPEVADSGGWNIDGNYWSRVVYWECKNGPSVKGDFGVQFKEGTAKIIDRWHQ